MLNYQGPPIIWPRREISLAEAREMFPHGSTPESEEWIRRETADRLDRLQGIIQMGILAPEDPIVKSELDNIASLRHTRITVRAFICTGPTPHPFTCLVRSTSELRIGERIPPSASYQLLGQPSWLPLPICPVASCSSIGEQQELYQPSLAQVPESERFVAWLSPDGSKLSVPARNDAPMAPRYVRAGYVRVSAPSVADLDRFDAVRARQTGNDVANEMNYDASERQHRREHIPDHDAEDIDKSEI